MSLSNQKEKQFEKHVQAILNEQRAKNDIDRALSVGELEELALSMGVTKEDWEELKVKALERLSLAKRFLESENHGDAKLEAEKAIALYPHIPDGSIVLAQCLYYEWLENPSSSLKEEVTFYAKEELKVDPNDKAAIKILNSLSSEKAKIKQKRKKIVYSLIVMSVIVLWGYVMSKNSSETHDQESNQEYLNAFIEAEEAVNAREGMIEVQLSRRENLIPELMSFLKADTRNEALVEELTGINSQSSESEGYEEILDRIQKEAYGNTQELGTILVQIEGAENRIAFQRGKYNDEVKAYNILVKKYGKDYPQFELKPYYGK